MLPYLLASIPAPRRGQRPEVGVADVAATCRRFLSEPRAREVTEALGADGEPDEPDERSVAGAVARSWADLAGQVDDAIVRVRCVRGHRDPAPYLQHPAGFRVDIVTAVTDAFEAPHPGARERRLDDLRWRLADELAATSPAGFAALYARAVQLRLAWRREAWDVDAGWSVLEARLRAIEDVASGGPSAASSAASTAASTDFPTADTTAGGVEGSVR